MISRLIRGIHFSSATRRALAGSLRRAVEDLRPIEREIARIQRKLETPRQRRRRRQRDAQGDAPAQPAHPAAGRGIRRQRHRAAPHAADRRARRAGSRDRQEAADRSEPAPGGFHRQALHQSRPAVPGSDSGRQHRPDEGRGQVRLHARLQVFDLRHLVGAPGHHARHRRSGAHHPHPGAHDRDHQQAGAHAAPACSRISAASRPPKSWP